jgi:hypothetical protein
MQRNSVWSVLPFFGLSVGQIKKKKKIRSFFFCKNGKNIFRTTNTSRARREKYALYLLHLPLCCDSLSSRVVEVFERAVVR